jgi:hypothetical protein
VIRLYINIIQINFHIQCTSHIITSYGVFINIFASVDQRSPIVRYIIISPTNSCELKIRYQPTIDIYNIKERHRVWRSLIVLCLAAFLYEGKGVYQLTVIEFEFRIQLIELIESL